MLYVTSSYTKSPERILIKREDGEEIGPRKFNAYRYSAERELTFMEAAQKLTANRTILYAIRVGDGSIKIGFTGNFYERARHIRMKDGGGEVLAFRFGTRQDESEIHKSLIAHRSRGREYYHPHPQVLELVNKWRAALGRDEIAA